MTGFQTTINAFFTSESGLAVYGLIVVALLDFLLGIAAAFRDGTFQLDAVAAWVRKHIGGRVLPITLILLFGYFGNQPILTVAAVPMALAYVAETVGSILKSWGPGVREVQAVPTD